MRKRDRLSQDRTTREKIADSIDISKEILLNTSKITAIGNREITVENYRGIIEYTPQKIKLISNPTHIEICGHNLEIKTMTKDFLYITGIVGCVSFCNEGR